VDGGKLCFSDVLEPVVIEIITNSVNKSTNSEIICSVENFLKDSTKRHRNFCKKNVATDVLAAADDQDFQRDNNSDDSFVEPLGKRIKL
jgi:type III secretory pathway component EscR